MKRGGACPDIPESLVFKKLFSKATYIWQNLNFDGLVHPRE